jgi:hypothetical protein
VREESSVRSGDHLDSAAPFIYGIWPPSSSPFPQTFPSIQIIDILPATACVAGPLACLRGSGVLGLEYLGRRELANSFKISALKTQRHPRYDDFHFLEQIKLTDQKIS